MRQAHEKKQLHNMPTQSLFTSMTALFLVLRRGAAQTIYAALPLPIGGIVWHGTA